MKKVVILAVAAMMTAGCEEDKPAPEKTLASIEVTAQPTKKAYTVGETFDPAGMAVTAKYSDNSTAPVTVTAAMLAYDFSTPGANKTVTVTYEGKTATVTGITVTAPPATLVSIAVTKQPDRKEYFAFEDFDMTGMVVTATYSDNSTAPVTVTAAMLAYDFTAAGTDKTVTITWEGKKATVEGITVVPPVLVSISAEGTVTQVGYGVGEPFNPAGLTVTAHFNFGPTLTVSLTDPDLLFEFDNLIAGTGKTVTVNLRGITFRLTSTFTVLTLNQRIAAIAATGTVRLYADETISSNITVSGNKNITLTGVGGMRAVRSSDTGGSIFTVGDNGYLTLDANVTVDGAGASRTDALVAVTGTSNVPAVFTMKTGSKLLNNNNTSTTNHGGGVRVQCSARTAVNNKTFAMEGGEIKNNKADWGGGVYVERADFNMSGGEISGNSCINMGDDVYFAYTADALTLSGSGIIGVIGFYYGSSATGKITLTGSYTGSIAAIDLSYYGTDIVVIRNHWVNNSYKVVDTGAQSKTLLDRFTLRNFTTATGTAKAAIGSGYHLYGTKTGENTVASFGILAAN